MDSIGAVVISLSQLVSLFFKRPKFGLCTKRRQIFQVCGMPQGPTRSLRPIMSLSLVSFLNGPIGINYTTGHSGSEEIVKHRNYQLPGI